MAETCQKHAGVHYKGNASAYWLGYSWKESETYGYTPVVRSICMYMLVVFIHTLLLPR